MTDLKIVDGDLSINPTTLDLDFYLKEEDNIATSLLRRVKTLKSQYSLNYYDYTNLTFKVIDLDYGSNIYSYLSQPSSILGYQALNELKQSLRNEPRISLLDIRTTESNSYSIKFIVQYNYKDNTHFLNI